MSDIKKQLSKMTDEEKDLLILKMSDENKVLKASVATNSTSAEGKKTFKKGERNRSSDSPNSLIDFPENYQNMGVMDKLSFQIARDQAILKSDRKGNDVQIATRERNILKNKEKLVKAYDDLLSRGDKDATKAAKVFETEVTKFRAELHGIQEKELVKAQADILKMKEAGLLPTE